MLFTNTARILPKVRWCYFLQVAPEEVAEKRLYSKKPSEYLEKKFRTLGDEALKCQNKCKYSIGRYFRRRIRSKSWICSVLGVKVVLLHCYLFIYSSIIGDSTSTFFSASSFLYCYLHFFTYLLFDFSTPSLTFFFTSVYTRLLLYFFDSSSPHFSTYSLVASFTSLCFL